MRTEASKRQLYTDVRRNLFLLLDGETDAIAVMSTVVAELYHGFPQFDWVGFYRVTAPRLLKVGPYQGPHGCLSIEFDRGVCGQCAREKATQIVDDVTQVPYYIACSTTTRSEIVAPVLDANGELMGVLDIDSDQLAAFDAVDRIELEALLHECFSVRKG